MIKTLLYALILIGYFNSFGQERYSKKELTEDVQYFFKTIKEVHVNPYFYSKDIDSISKNIIEYLPDQLDRDSFRHYLVTRTNNIWDTHTGLSDFYFGSVVSDSSNLIPNNFEIINNGLLFVHGKKSMQVISINKIPINLILDKFYKYCKADMSPIVKKRFVERYFSLLFNAEYGSYTEFEICVKNPNSQIIILKSIKYKDLFKPKKTAKDFESFYFQKYSIAYFIINTFDAEKSEELNSFLSNEIRSIDSLKIKVLVIDNRFNGGGSDNCVSVLLDYLYENNYTIMYGFNKSKDENGNIQNGSYTWERKNDQEIVFKGKLLILQSTETASAAMDFSSAIKTSHRGLIIGEPTTDPVYSFANAKNFIMPNTKIKFRSAQSFYAMPGSYDDVNYGVMPDLFYKFENDNLDLTEIRSLIKMAKDYYKGYFYFDYKN
jgi:hypothetical protein